RGASIESIADIGEVDTPCSIGFARVTIQVTGRYVPTCGTGDFAFIFACIGLEGVIDLAAWLPRTGQVATRLGIAGLIGEREAETAQYDLNARPVRVWRDPIGWLRAGRRGVVVANEFAAAHVLSGLNVFPEDYELGRALLAMRVPGVR